MFQSLHFVSKEESLDIGIYINPVFLKGFSEIEIQTKEELHSNLTKTYQYFFNLFQNGNTSYELVKNLKKSKQELQKYNNFF